MSHSNSIQPFLLAASGAVVELANTHRLPSRRVGSWRMELILCWCFGGLLTMWQGFKGVRLGHANDPTNVCFRGQSGHGLRPA